MAEYIERDAAMLVARHAWGKGLEPSQFIEIIPAADVAPVVHGQWIIGVDDDFDVKCSKCEWTDIFEVAGIAAVERNAKTMHYCPNCGAKMDGGADNETD